MTNADTLRITMPSDTEIIMTRVFDAPRALVFEAWTSTDLVPRWMLGPDEWTMPVCESDLRPGGAWHYVWRRTDGTEMEMHGTFVEIDPPARLVTTERWGEPWPETVNTVVLEERDGKTLATITVTYPSKDARDAAADTGMADGAAMSFDRLDAVLAAA